MLNGEFPEKLEDYLSQHPEGASHLKRYRLMLESINFVTEQIRAFDEWVEELATKEFPQTRLLRQIPGVGPVTALTFLATIGDPDRFPSSRMVASFVGLTPSSRSSGNSSPQLRISKRGSNILRSYLVQSAQYILGPFGPDSDLRRWGLKIVSKGGRHPKRRAVVAVARKLSVLLLVLWKTEQVYEPLLHPKVNLEFRTEARSRKRCGDEAVESTALVEGELEDENEIEDEVESKVGEVNVLVSMEPPSTETERVEAAVSSANPEDVIEDSMKHRIFEPIAAGQSERKNSKTRKTKATRAKTTTAKTKTAKVKSTRTRKAKAPDAAKKQARKIADWGSTKTKRLAASVEESSGRRNQSSLLNRIKKDVSYAV